MWQYSHQVLTGLASHKGPILTIANWSMTKAGIPFSTLWSLDFKDEFFLSGLRQWLSGETVVHDLSHVHPLKYLKLPDKAARTGAELAGRLRHDKAIMGVFDEGCMCMYNAIVEDSFLLPLGVGKERLSQSALYAEMLATPEAEARAVRSWLDARGMRFLTGPNPETDLTDAQILEQCKMYISALRIADDFGCDAIGVQYQQGLKDLCPASDIAEGLLNNSDRPPVNARGNGRVLYEGQPLPHFNEVDECAGLDALITNRGVIWLLRRKRLCTTCATAKSTR